MLKSIYVKEKEYDKIKIIKKKNMIKKRIYDFYEFSVIEIEMRKELYFLVSFFLLWWVSSLCNVYIDKCIVKCRKW